MDHTEDRLLRLLDSVNDWLKFAETKNGAISGVSGIGMIATLARLDSSEELTKIESIGLPTATIGFIFSVVVALLSFIPEVDPTRFLRKQVTSEDLEPNVFFFGHVARMNSNQFVYRVLETSGVTDREPSKIEVQIAEQIVINSRITKSKLYAFNVGLVAFLISTFLTMSVILISSI